MYKAKLHAMAATGAALLLTATAHADAAGAGSPAGPSAPPSAESRISVEQPKPRGQDDIWKGGGWQHSPRAVDKAGNWRVTELRSIKGLMKRYPKAKIRIVVVSVEELARLGLVSNGRIIYRYVNGVIEVIVTSPSPDQGWALAQQLAQILSELIPNDAAQQNGTPLYPGSKWPSTKPLVPLPRDFIENASRQNVSPS